MKKYKLSLCGLFFIVTIAGVAAVPFRLHQYLACLDRSTGFWIVKDYSYPILIALILAVLLTALLIPLLSNQLPRAKFIPIKSPLAATVSVLAACGFLVDAILRMLDLLDIWSTIQLTENVGVTYYISSGFLPKLLQVLFGLLSTVYLLFVAKGTAKETTEYQTLHLLALTPVLWGICRMMSYFVEPISYRNVSQLMLELLFLGFYLIFALEFARIAGGVNSKNSVWLLFFSGYSAVFLGAIEALPPIFLTVFGAGDVIPEQYPVQWVDGALICFLLVTLLWNTPSFASRRGYQIMPEETVAEAPFPKAGTAAPVKLFTPEEPHSPVRPTAAAGNKTIPADYLTVKQVPEEKVLPSEKE